MLEITYRQLAKAVADLAVASARNADTITKNAEWISEEARDTARDADQLGALRVDKATIAETRELADILKGLSDSVLNYATAAHTTSKHATAVHTVNQKLHGQINEAAGRSPVGREVYDIDRGWFEQE